jgi:hypothetical protein
VNTRTQTLVGLALFAVGAFLVWDSYEGKGRPTPLVLRPFLPV